MEDAVATVRFSEAASVLARDGFVVLLETQPTATSAWVSARAVMSGAAPVDALCAAQASWLEQVGRFVIPPPDMPQRDFQALHVDFGIPLGTSERADVARYTALYVDPDVPAPQAQTRLVLLGRLATQREWPRLDALAQRLARRLGPDGSVGVLGRVIEAVDSTRELPAQDAPGFLCGMEFTSLAQERSFFAAHGLDLADAETRVVVEPGQVMVFDNLRAAHGRVGQRHTQELHQLCMGFRRVDRAGQRFILRSFLRALTDRPGRDGEEVQAPGE